MKKAIVMDSKDNVATLLADVDANDVVQVLFFVETLSGPPLVRLELREFRFPIAEHVRLQTGEAAHFSDPIKQFIRLGLGIR